MRREDEFVDSCPLLYVVPTDHRLKSVLSLAWIVTLQMEPEEIDYLCCGSPKFVEPAPAKASSRSL